MNSERLSASTIPTQPKQRWRKAYGLLRNLSQPSPDWTNQYFNTFCYAQSKYPKDPLTRSLHKRLVDYKYIKKGPDPDIPF